MSANHGSREVVVVTGASAGVGRATVRHFARRGADVGLIARGHDGLEGARREVEAAGGRAVVLPVDVANADEVEAAAERVEQELGPIDIWVNNAIVTVFAPVTDVAPEEFRRVTEVAYLGTVFGTKAALARMRPRDRGTIVQVGSALAYRAIPLQSAYCAAKHAVRGFTDSLRVELMHDRSNVRLTMVQLPALNTPQFTWSVARLPKSPQPVPPIYQPEVAAQAIYWAAHHHRREITVGTPAVRAIIGNKIVPGLADRQLARSAFGSQQTGQPLDPGRPTNLWDPVPGDHGAHGPFSDLARRRSLQLWANERRGVLAGAAAGGIAALAAAAALVRLRER